MTGGVGAGRYLIEFVMLGVPDLMRVHKVFSLQVAEGYNLIRIKILPVRGDLLQRLAKCIQLPIGHFPHRPKYNRALAFRTGQMVESVVEIFPE